MAEDTQGPEPRPSAATSADTAAAPPATPAPSASVESGGWRVAFLPFLIVLLGVSLSAFVWNVLRNTAAMRDRVRFELAVEREMDRLVDRVRVHGTLIRGATALFTANAPEPVTAERFAAYVSRLDIDRNYPGMQGVGFALRLRDDSATEAVLASARRRAPEFKLWPEHAGERSSIVFLEPLDARNRRALGFDMTTDPVRREAMDRARDRAAPALSGPVRLLQEIEGQPEQRGFLLYAPVFRGAGVPQSIESRRSRLDGFVYSPFRAGDLLSRLYDEPAETRVLSLAIYDGPTPHPETLMFQTDSDHTAYQGPLRTEVPLDLAGRRWTAVATARPPFQHLSSGRTAPTAAIAGIGGTLALAGLVWSQGRSARDAQRARDEVRAVNESLEHRIASRTRELEIARSTLQATNAALEETVARRTLQLRDSINEAQRFVYVASHDLRAPLVNIVGFAGELGAATRRLDAFVRDMERALPGTVPADIHTLLDEDIPEALSFIHSSTGRMERLISTILKLAREERRTLNPEVLRLDEVLGTVVDGQRKQIEAVGASVTIAEGMPEIVCDRVALEQIFANLVENAVKYLDDRRRGVIRITGREEGPRVVIEVEDNGRGIAAQDHERVFELFRRAGSADRPGEGLGLAFVRALVRRLDGEIKLRSTPDQGSVFTVTLPRILAPPPQETTYGS